MTIGPLMIDFEGTTLTSADRDLIADPRIGGVILFTRNYENPAQCAELVAAVREGSPDPILVAVDQEGGRVQRFKEGFTKIPAMHSLGLLYEDDHQAALIQAESYGYIMASECRAIGIDLSFAPVLDCDHHHNTVIGDRAFHHKPTVITTLAKAFMEGMHRAGMPATGKHFPGHGGVEEDTHNDIAQDERDLATLQEADLCPFQALIEAGIQAIMPAHVIYPAVDSYPASVSATWLKRILRTQYGFEGAIFSDDLSMAGVSVVGDLPERVARALEATCDMVLICNDRPGVEAVLQGPPLAQSPESHARLTHCRGW